MEIIHFNSAIFPVFKNSVISIGSFDGVHQGHAKILSQLSTEAKKLQSKSILISFDRHPRQLLDGDKESFRILSTLDEKKILLEKYQIDYLVIVPFTLDFAQLRPEDYIENFLIKYFNPKIIIIGFDHRFGINGSGNIHLLKNYAAQNKFDIIEIPKLEIENNKISSTKIRQYIQDGHISKANELLAHPYLFTGRVTSGDKIGSKIGFPTANLVIEHADKLIPPNGIYVAKVKLETAWYNAMLYIGNRPTIGESLDRHIELSLYDFHSDIYGRLIEVYVLDFVRQDMKFDNLQELQTQIKKDEIVIADKLLQYDILHTNKQEFIRVAVVILNFNGKKYLEQYLKGVIQHSYPDADIYVIDNASTDDSLSYLQKHFPEVKLICLQKNYGYAGGYTHGLKQIEADYFALINSDIKITESWLKPILQTFKKDNKIMAVQPKILSMQEEHKFEYAGAAGGLIDSIGVPFCYGRIFDKIENDENQYSEQKEIFWSSGAAMVVNAKLFHALGGFDESYFAHQEEIDLCWRIKQCGGKIFYEPASTVFHLGGGTLDYENPKKTFLNYKNNLTTLFKNNPILRFAIILFIRIILDGLTAIQFILKGKLKNAFSIVKAYLTFLLQFKNNYQGRKTNQNLIEKIKFAPSNKSAMLKGSILWQYFILQKRKTADISNNQFHG